jgi:hypothetical protein
MADAEMAKMMLIWKGVMLTWVGLKLAWMGLRLTWQVLTLTWMGVMLTWLGLMLELMLRNLSEVKSRTFSALRSSTLLVSPIISTSVTSFFKIFLKTICNFAK